MSRIGIKPVKIEKDVTIEIKDQSAIVKGPLGELIIDLPSNVSAEVKDSDVIVSRKGNSQQAVANHGTIRVLIANAIEGVTKGYKKELEISGIGYRAAMEGTTLVLNVGWNHPVKFPAPEGIKFDVKDAVVIEVSGIDKQLVGLWSAKVRSIRKPEPYKGKGIKYSDEIVRRKSSKSVKEE
ncbi:50S ribosomal protein L6 [Candidatus Dojkabacteria bacterium]|nr:50S ribosomal protein L6 [Candidatus Dojkabacteria bacterium]